MRTFKSACERVSLAGKVSELEHFSLMITFTILKFMRRSRLLSLSLLSEYFSKWH